MVLFFQQNISAYLRHDVNFNKSLTDDIVSFEQLDPGIYIWTASSAYWAYAYSNDLDQLAFSHTRTLIITVTLCLQNPLLTLQFTYRNGSAQTTKEQVYVGLRCSDVPQKQTIA